MDVGKCHIENDNNNYRRYTIVMSQGKSSSSLQRALKI